MSLRPVKDITYSLLNDIGKARMFFERSLFEESFELTASVIEKARRLGLNEIVLMAQKLELEFFLSLDFPGISERELFEKHTLQRKTLKSISLITEHAHRFHSHIGAAEYHARSCNERILQFQCRVGKII